MRCYLSAKREKRRAAHAQAGPAFEDCGGDFIGVLAGCFDHSVGNLFVKRLPNLEDLPDFDDRAGGREGRALVVAAGVGPEPACQLGRVGGQPDDEAKFAQPAAVRRRAGRRHRRWRRSRSDNRPGVRREFALPSRGKTAPPPRRKSRPRIARPVPGAPDPCRERSDRRGRPRSAPRSTCRSHDSRRAPNPDLCFERNEARGRVSFLADRR